MSEKAKTLIFLTPGFAKDEGDTNCLPMHQDLVRTFKRKFPLLRIVVLAFDYPYFKGKYKWFDIDVISFDGRNRGGVKKLLLWRSIRKELALIDNSSEIVGLLSMWLDACAFVGKKFADKHDLKHYCWLIGQDAKPGNKYVRKIRPRPSELVALSDFIQSEFEKNYGIKPQYLIPPGINGAEYTSLESVRNIDIIATGSLIPLKQFDLFLEVIHQLKKQFPQINACLIGDGPERKRLEALADRLALTSNVTFTGELPHSLVLEKMQNAKLFLHTSSYEAFGMVCLEALASGASVISFVRPMTGQIENWFVAANKEEMISKSIQILSNNRPTYNSVIPYRIERTVEQFAGLLSI
jgi:glycosyltransferase involved in cell wall biosynthesis